MNIIAIQKAGAPRFVHDDRGAGRLSGRSLARELRDGGSRGALADIRRGGFGDHDWLPCVQNMR